VLDAKVGDNVPALITSALKVEIVLVDELRVAVTV
jgi:hypothetical protein